MNNDHLKQLVPCGHCAPCLLKRQLGWTLRNMLEQSISATSAFVTLTYSDETRPTSLEKSHIQKYIKRLREAGQKSLRYFCVGEYGAQSEHAHWHLMLYHLTPHASVELLTKLWRSPSKEPYGNVHVGSATRFSARYTAKYSLKSASFNDPENPQNIMLSSRRPAIGVTRAVQIAEWMAPKYPALETFPMWWRCEGVLHPIDKTLYKHARQTYLDHGGTIERDQSNKLIADYKAFCYQIEGNPLEADMNRLALSKIDAQTSGCL